MKEEVVSKEGVNTPSMKEKLTRSADRVAKWVEDHNYQGYEPFEGNSSCLHALTFNNLLLERYLQQTVLRCPFNIRPLIGIKPKPSTKGRGYMAWGYLLRYECTGDDGQLRKAEECLDWLDKHKAPKFEKHSWSNHFDFAGRGGKYTSDDPIIVWTSLIGQAYVKAFELTQEERWLRIADSVCGWIMDLPRNETDSGTCLAYLAFAKNTIHNASMLGAAMLAKTAKHTNNSNYLRLARSAIEYTCNRQRPDGSWWYGDEPKYRWIDNFHTGYNLDSLKHYIDSTGDKTCEENLRKGFDYYKKTFFEPSGMPRYYHDRTFPVDSQCCSQSIDTLALFADEDEESLPLALKVANWVIDNMQDPRDGHFYHRILPWTKVKTPMLHWAQATMFKALALLAAALPDHVGFGAPRVNRDPTE